MRASGWQGRLYRPITPAAVKATLVTLRTVLNYAAKNKGVAMRAFDWPTWIKNKKRYDEGADVRIMSEAEQALIWPVLAELDDDVREVADFNLGHPKRINELLPLNWPHIDLSSKQPTIRIRLKGRSKPVLKVFAKGLKLVS